MARESELAAGGDSRHMRPYQGIGNVLLTAPVGVPANTNGPIHCRQRLGGMLRYYHRKVA